MGSIVILVTLNARQPRVAGSDALGVGAGIWVGTPDASLGSNSEPQWLRIIDHDASHPRLRRRHRARE